MRTIVLVGALIAVAGCAGRHDDRADSCSPYPVELCQTDVAGVPNRARHEDMFTLYDAVQSDQARRDADTMRPQQTIAAHASFGFPGTPFHR